jgi:hypothetical protein
VPLVEYNSFYNTPTQYTMTTATSTADHHLETIDYKPPAVISEEKKMDDNHCATDEDGHDKAAEEEPVDEGDGQFDLYSEEAEWDEGGKSHCGYAEVVHSTLMSVGETVHKLVGEPSPSIEKELKAVGNWFQEASYAARDLFRAPQEGEETNGMQEDAIDAVKTLLRGGSHVQNDEEDENKDPAAPTTEPSSASGEPSEPTTLEEPVAQSTS